MTSLGFLGPKGTYTEIAAYKYNGPIDEYVAFADIKTLFSAVKSGQVDKAVVPLENSLEGAVTLTLDLLAEIDLKIYAEIIIPINHSLLVKPGTKLEQIRKVTSHPQALAQCRNFLQENLADFSTNIASSTVEAVSRISQEDKDSAAIANCKVAENYPVEVLKENIQDNQDNWTRFVVLATETAEITGNDKTSLILAPGKDKPGNLYKILAEFAQEDINLTRIESRPAKKKLGDYMFFIDLEGHYQEKKIATVLNRLENKTESLKVLGSYPAVNIYR